VKTRLPWLLAGLALALAFAALGRWQWQRGELKQALLLEVAQVIEQRDAEPLARAAQDDRLAWAAGSGRFLPGPVLLLDNQRHGARVGVRVFVPFQPEVGAPLLADLGWHPLPADRSLPSIAPPSGRQRLSGLLTPPPSTGLALGPAHVAQGNTWLLTRVDIPALSTATGLALAPRVLRLDPALPIGYARDLDVLPNTLPPERHRGYALQWFGLSATVLALLAYFLFFRRRP